VFLRTLLRELAGTLQDVVGLEDASGFISVVGQRMGSQISDDYKQALNVAKLNREQVAHWEIESVRSPRKWWDDRPYALRRLERVLCALAGAFDGWSELEARHR